MTKPLVIVESPAKAKTISKYLKGEYEVKASVGHIRDLPKSKIGVDIKNNFTPTYEILRGKENIVEALRKASKNVFDIYLAADPDREGEAICWHLKELLDGENKRFHRVIMNQITQSTVEEAFRNPMEIDLRRVNAQQARRIIDRLVGYQISPILWDKVRRGLSAGRVQSIAVKIICDREKEITAFKPEEYWNIEALLSAKLPPPFQAKLIKEDGKNIKITNEEKANEIIKKLEKAEYVVKAIQKKKKKKNPYPPFITSKLQQIAATRLGFTVKKTMTIAQRLYEGVEIGESGLAGLITYMRTDSTRIAPEAMSEVRNFISKEFPPEYLPEKPNFYRSRKTAQEAHEAIRPTSVMRAPAAMSKFLSKDELKLYTLIWNQFVASQMSPAEYNTTSVDVTADNFTFRTSGSQLIFDGFLKVLKSYDRKEKEEATKTEKEESSGEDDYYLGKEEETDRLLPPLEENQKLKLEQLIPSQHFTQPPPRFSEATLVRELENNGIGRPSTYAQIVNVIQNREYVIKEDKIFLPTELGMLVTDLLENSFEDIMQIKYTARLEENLDKIEEGKEDWITILRNFNIDFAKDLEQAKAEMRNIKAEAIPTEEKCDKCGKPMVIKWGRFGKFLACSGYPNCKNTKEILPEIDGSKQPDEDIKHCPNCGKEMVLKRGRWGVFLACSGYPDCRTTMPVDPKTLKVKDDVVITETCPKCSKPLVKKIGRYGEFIACSGYPECNYIKQNTIGMKCPVPDCDGEIVERKSRRGTNFYGCTNYPQCNFAAPNKPIDKPCPVCGHKYILEKVLKKKGTVHYCNNSECKWEEVVIPPDMDK